ncbi:MAG: phytoene desaturase family protein [Fimbriimonas sp.]
MSRQTTVIIGAGLGGLATALRMAHTGDRVIVLEKTDRIGGRNRAETVNGCTFDGGPTLMMMLDPFYKLFADVGERLEDHLDIELCDPSYRVFYSDGSRLDGSPNIAKMVRQIHEICGPKDAQAYAALIGDLGALYRDAMPNFVQKNFDSPLDFFGFKQLGLVARHGMLSNLGKRIERYVDDPRLRMLFTFQTMYLGLSPFEAPWVYSVLTYMEYGEGIWYPKGGMVEICGSVARLAEKKGAEIRLNSPVKSVVGKRVELESGEVIEADSVVCNADLPYAERALQKAPSPKKRRYSCSAYMMYIDYAGSLPTLLHHNVFFGPDFKGNLDQIFHKLVLPDDPAFYACVSARSDAAKAPAEHENLYVLVPCPNLDRPWSEADAVDLQEKIFRRLAKEAGFDRSLVQGIQTRSPQDWADELNLDRGAAFGLSHDFWQSAFFRPSNQSKSNPDMVFVGASTVPGNGLPMVLISAELAQDRLLKKRAKR